MTPREMAKRLEEMASGGCRRPFGESGLTCREYDAAAMYKDEGAPCERCQAVDALETLRQPWKKECQELRQRLRTVRHVVEDGTPW